MELVLAIINAIAFLLIGYDKRMAIANKQRIAENTLLAFVAIGGTLGSGIAMLLFRHKTKKWAYLWKFWAIAILQVLVLYGLFHFGVISFNLLFTYFFRME